MWSEKYGCSILKKLLKIGAERRRTPHPPPLTTAPLHQRHLNLHLRCSHRGLPLPTPINFPGQPFPVGVLRCPAPTCIWARVCDSGSSRRPPRQRCAIHFDFCLPSFSSGACPQPCNSISSVGYFSLPPVMEHRRRMFRISS